MSRGCICIRISIGHIVRGGGGGVYLGLSVIAIEEVVATGGIALNGAHFAIHNLVKLGNLTRHWEMGPGLGAVLKGLDKKG